MQASKWARNANFKDANQILDLTNKGKEKIQGWKESSREQWDSNKKERAEKTEMDNKQIKEGDWKMGQRIVRKRTGKWGSEQRRGGQAKQGKKEEAKGWINGV